MRTAVRPSNLTETHPMHDRIPHEHDSLAFSCLWLVHPSQFAWSRMGSFAIAGGSARNLATDSIPCTVSALDRCCDVLSVSGYALGLLFFEAHVYLIL